MAPIIFIASPPRSGSKLTYNLTRSILSSQYELVRPFKPPVGKLGNLPQKEYNPSAKDTAFCYHLHGIVTPKNCNSTIISNTRDLYDLARSWMRFVHGTIDDVLENLPLWKTYLDYYSENADLLIDFSELDDIEALARRIAEALDIRICSDDIDAYRILYSKEGVQYGVDHMPSKDTTYAYNHDGSKRKVNIYTTFQEGHITTEPYDEIPQIREAIAALEESTINTTP